VGHGTIQLGADGATPLETRLAHEPSATWGFVVSWLGHMGSACSICIARAVPSTPCQCLMSATCCVHQHASSDSAASAVMLYGESAAQQQGVRCCNWVCDVMC
jgi:hypothetical protein